jgi:glycosyltransferase involved in cell wall biosynthesis
MRILILNWKDIRNPTAGGAEIVTFEHAKRWVEAGHRVTWLSSGFKGLKKEEIVDGINVKRFGNIYGVYLYAPFFYLSRRNKSEGGFDLVVDEVHGIPFFTPLFVRKPILVLIHEVAGEIWDYMYSPPLNYFGKTLEKVYLKLYASKYFWTDADATIDELVENGVKRRKCVSIPCPSNLRPLGMLPEKNKQPTFIWVSRIVKMKGIEDVLQAFSLIIKKLPNARLLIVGDGEKSYVNYLKKEILKKYGIEKSVDFMGFLTESEKVKALRSSHMLLHASVKEGWGIVVVEAASQATPSVVYNVPGLSESVKNGITGLVLKKNTPEEMAGEAIKLYKDKNKYRKLQNGALKWAKSLSWDEASRKSLALIEQLSKNKKQRTIKN